MATNWRRDSTTLVTLVASGSSRSRDMDRSRTVAGRGKPDFIPPWSNRSTSEQLTTSCSTYRTTTPLKRRLTNISGTNSAGTRACLVTVGWVDGADRVEAVLGAGGVHVVRQW